MGLCSKIGKFLLAGSLFFSAIQAIFMVETYERVRQDYVAKVSGVMDLLENYFRVTSTTKHDMIRGFVILFSVIKGAGGGLLFINDIFLNRIGTYLLMYYFLIATPIVYDFYLYKVGDPEFLVLLHGFMQNMALFGAVWFLLRMKLKIYKRHLKKKIPKSKSK